MVQRPAPELSISSVVAVSRCPVRFSIEKADKKPESPRYVLAKQLSYHLGEELDSDVVWEEACLVHDGPDLSLKPFLSEMVRLCGNRQDWRQPRESDVRVSSDIYHIHGTIDRLFEEEPLFAIVRSSAAPSHGVYAADRVRITGYTICLREMLGDSIRGGSIEYLPSGVSRFVTVEPRDKRKFLHALHEARRIMNGGLPRKPLRPPCTHCPYGGDCEPSDGTRLSDLF
jgi:CRISPR-associated exonuclease Cas4